MNSPNGSTPDGSPDSSSPDGSSPNGSSPDGSSPDGSTPDGSSPKVTYEEQLALLEEAAGKRLEDKMYTHLIDAIGPSCPNLELVDSHAHPDKNADSLELGSLKPDISVYNKNSKRRGETDFSTMELFIEVKARKGDDPFRDDTSPFEHGTKDSTDTRNQVISYRVAHGATQFRTHIFSVLIIKDHARLMRWDSAGAVVTAAFPYCNRNSHLLEFFRRFDQLDPEKRGIDRSVSDPSESESADARKVLGLKANVPLVKLEVHDNSTDKAAYYVGPMPTFMRHASPTGRCTRTFVAYDVQTGATVFLKDTWRIDLADMHKEGDIYERLKQANVSHIAPFVCGADVRDHRTRTDAYVNKPWARPLPKALRPHRQSRLVLGVVARPLTSFRSSWELVNALADALQAHKEAYEAGILHRDISVGNIMITPEGRGLLIDWDMCKCIDILPRIRQSERTGTWQFISAMLLMNLTAAPTLADDLESFMHVLAWVALRYMPHKLKAAALTKLMQDYFDDHYEDDEEGAVKGGTSKMTNICFRTIPVRCGFRNPWIKLLLNVLMDTFAAHYEEEEEEVVVVAWARTSTSKRRSIERLALIENSNWMLKTLRCAVMDRSIWPSDDKSCLNPLVQVSE